MKISAARSVVSTIIHLSEPAARFVQVRQTPRGPQLLTLKTAPAATLTAETVTQLARTLPAPPGRVVLVLPKSQVLTRTLTLPADDPGELTAMARYALADSVPYPLDECCVTIQRLATVEQRTTVLAVIIPKALLDRFLALLAPAGLTPQAIALTAEGLVRWHQRLSPRGPDGPRLVLDTLGPTLELVVVDGDRLLNVRSIPLPVAGDLPAAWLLTHVQDTLRGYTQERAGPPVTALTVSGPLLSAQGIVATLAEHLALPVTVADPTASPFTQMLAHEADTLTTLPWSDLFGLALVPSAPVLDLLPAEVRQQQAREARRRQGLELAAWLGLCAWLGAGLGVVETLRQGRLQHLLRQEQATVAAPAGRAAALAHYLARLAENAPGYVAAATVLSNLQSAVPANVALDRITLEAATLTVSGTAPTLGDAMALVTQLQRQPTVRTATLRTATAERGGRLHFLVEARR